MTVQLLRDVTEQMPDLVDYVKETAVVKSFLTSGGGRHSIGESIAGTAGGLSKAKLIAWFNYSPSDLRQLTQQFALTGATFTTLTEYVQGPAPTNQRVLAAARVCETMVPIFEFLLALQVEGKLDRTMWKGNDARGLVKLLFANNIKGCTLDRESAESDSAKKWLDKFEGKGGDAYKEAWVEHEAKLLSHARAMELKMLMLLTGMVEGETDVNVAEHILEKLDAQTLVALLNVHWQRQMAIKRRTKVSSQISPVLEQQKQEEKDLAFQYFALIDTLVDDALETNAAANLRKIYQKWIAAEGKDIVASIRSIEILNEDGMLGRVHFQMPEFVQLVWTSNDVEEVKQEIVTQVKRDNPEEKLKDFWLRTEELIAVLRYQFTLRKLPHKLYESAGCVGFAFGSFIEILARGHLVLFWTSTTCAFVLNFLMLATIGDADADDIHSITRRPELGMPAIILFTSMCFETLSHIVAHLVLFVREELNKFRAAGGLQYALPLITHMKTRSTTVDSKFSVKASAVVTTLSLCAASALSLHAMALSPLQPSLGPTTLVFRHSLPLCPPRSPRPLFTSLYRNRCAHCCVARRSPFALSRSTTSRGSCSRTA